MLTVRRNSHKDHFSARVKHLIDNAHLPRNLCDSEAYRVLVKLVISPH